MQAESGVAVEAQKGEEERELRKKHRRCDVNMQIDKQRDTWKRCMKRAKCVETKKAWLCVDHSGHL